MIKLHMLSQIPSSCLCIQLSVCATAPKNFTKFFPSHVRILFCTDKIESIEKQDLAPRQRTGDLSNFSARSGASPARLLQELCYFGSQADVAISVFREVSKNAVLPQLVATFVECSKSDSRELCASACNSVGSRFCEFL